MSDWRRTVLFVTALCLVLTLVFPWVLVRYEFYDLPTPGYALQNVEVTELCPLWKIDSEDRVMWDLVALQVVAMAVLGTVLFFVGIPPFIEPDSNWGRKPQGR